MSYQKHLTLSDRIFIEQELLQGSSYKSIALSLCKDPTTIAKEVKRNRKLVSGRKVAGNCKLCQESRHEKYEIHRFKHTKSIGVKLTNLSGRIIICHIITILLRDNMHNSEYKKRMIDNMVSDCLEIAGAVCIEGPKWCGKTWTSEFHSKSAIYIGDPKSNYQNRNLATIDPLTVLQGDVPRLIDEWQEFPWKRYAMANLNL